jgi:hypothetical protein
MNEQVIVIQFSTVDHPPAGVSIKIINQYSPNVRCDVYKEYSSLHMCITQIPIYIETPDFRVTKHGYHLIFQKLQIFFLLHQNQLHFLDINSFLYRWIHTMRLRSRQCTKPSDTLPTHFSYV